MEMVGEGYGEGYRAVLMFEIGLKKWVSVHYKMMAVEGKALQSWQGQ